MSKYPNSGALNPTREKRSTKSPDFWGRIEISGDVLAALNAGKPIRLSGWKRNAPHGVFISLAAEVERPRSEAASDSAMRRWEAMVLEQVV